MSDIQLFKETHRALCAGEIDIKHDTNEFVGHTDVLEKLLNVAPADIKADFEFLHGLMNDARDASGSGVLEIFPRLCDPQLAEVEGRIADYIAEHCGVRMGDGQYEAGKVYGSSQSQAWPTAGSPLTSNRFPYLLDTSASNYFSNRFWNGAGAPPGFVSIPEGGKAVFKGQYLRCRYFAFHPSDFDTNTLPTLIDRDIKPDDGSGNPFAGPVSDGEGQRFTAELNFQKKPANPAPNTMYGGETRHGERNIAVFLLLRTTASFLGAMPPNSTGVDLPSLTIYDAAGNQVEHYDEANPYPEGCEVPRETTQFASLPIPDCRGLNEPEAFNTRSNWGLPYDILASDDLLYLNAPFTDRLGEVMVVRGKAFRAPNTPSEAVYLPEMQIRGFTLTTYNFWAGICNDAIVDHELNLDEDGYFTVFVAKEENKPDMSKLANANWINWGPYLDGQLTFRMLLRNDETLTRLKAHAEGQVQDEELAPYMPIAKHCSLQDVENGNWRALFA